MYTPHIDGLSPHFQLASPHSTRPSWIGGIYELSFAKFREVYMYSMCQQILLFVCLFHSNSGFSKMEQQRKLPFIHSVHHWVFAVQALAHVHVEVHKLK